MNEQQWQIWCQSQIGVQNSLDRIVELLERIQKSVRTPGEISKELNRRKDQLARRSE